MDFDDTDAIRMDAIRLCRVYGEVEQHTKNTDFAPIFSVFPNAQIDWGEECRPLREMSADRLYAQKGHLEDEINKLEITLRQVLLLINMFL